MSTMLSLRPRNRHQMRVLAEVQKEACRRNNITYIDFQTLTQHVTYLNSDGMHYLESEVADAGMDMTLLALRLYSKPRRPRRGQKWPCSERPNRTVAERYCVPARALQEALDDSRPTKERVAWRMPVAPP